MRSAFAVLPLRPKVFCPAHFFALKSVCVTCCVLLGFLISMSPASQAFSDGLAGNPETAAGAGLYVKVQLADRVKVSALKPGDVLEGKLARDVYSGDRELFPTGSRVRLTVDNLERRRRVPNDHWPWVIKFFTPRHESYPTFHSALVSPPDGGEVPLRVSLISISNKIEVHAQAKSKQTAQSEDSTTAQEVSTGASQTSSAPKKKSAAPIMTLEATLAHEEESTQGTEAQVTSSASAGSVTLPAGTQAKIILLGGVSASRSRPGDSLQARVLEPVRQGSKVVVPAGSILEGKVVKSTPPRWLSRAGSLYLRFTGITFPGGRDVPIAASLSGAELDRGSRTRMDSEGGMKGDHPGKAWMLIHIGVTSGIAKVADDGTQLLVEALVSTATDASTAGTAKIVAACASGIFMITRHGRDVILPRFTEMDVLFDRPAPLGSPAPPETR
jgi:hypothetical protein